MTLQLQNKKLAALYYFCGVLLICIAILIASLSASAQVVTPNRFLQLSDTTAGQTNVRYTTGFSVTSLGYVLGSVSLQFCDNSPLIGLPCNPPVGLDVSTAVISSQSGVTDFTIAPGATANSLILTRTAAVVTPMDIRVELSGVTNPTNQGTYFARIQTYPTTNASGGSHNQGGMVFIINRPINLDVYVPPYLFLCVAVTLPGYICDGASGNFVDLGELSPNGTRTGTSQFVVATNAGSGFVVYYTGTPPTSGNNVIPGMAVRQVSQRGVSQFGINLRDNSAPNVGTEPAGIGTGIITTDYSIQNQFKFASNDTLVFSNTTTQDKKFTVSYIVNVNSNQKPGIYNTTLLYIALATF